MINRHCANTVSALVNLIPSQPQENTNKQKGNCHTEKSWDWAKGRMLWEHTRRVSSWVKGLPRRRGSEIEL